MIEEDVGSLAHISYLYETSYYRVEIYEQGTQLWKSYMFTQKEYIEKLMPYLFLWNIHVCFHCNQLQLLFPYQRSRSLHEVWSEIKTMDEALDHIQHMFLTLQGSNLPSYVASILCDQKNIALCENNEWNLYANPRLEKLLRKPVVDDTCWQSLCAELLLQTKEHVYAQLPTPSVFQSTIDKLKEKEVLNYHEILAMMEQVKGCYQDVQARVKVLKRILHYVGIILLIAMIFLSILFFAYEYVKQRQEYFNTIEKIGDVLVNPNE